MTPIELLTQKTCYRDFFTECGFYSDGYQVPAEADVEHIETHLSHIFLLGDFAFKLKKAVRFPFVDFSTLEARKKYCREELRLNRRYSPDLYLGVLALVMVEGELKIFTEAQLSKNPTVEPFDYLVWIRRFRQEAVLEHLAEAGKLEENIVAETAQAVAQLHAKADPHPEFEQAKTLEWALVESLDAVDNRGRDFLGAEAWEEFQREILLELQQQKQLLERRRARFCRELHGDLHLGNICLYQGQVRLFDGLEFRPDFSNGDTWTDLCFLLMSLQFHGLPKLRQLARAIYVETTQDYQGHGLEKLLVTYLALVRAKVELLSLGSDGGKNDALHTARSKTFLQLAYRELITKSLLSPTLFAFGGYSGSGKSTLANLLAERTGVIHLRADVIRKQLLGISILQKAPPEAYSEEMNERTALELLRLSREILQLGQSVIVDSVFQHEPNRARIETLAREEGVRFLGFWCEVPEDVARARIEKRKNDASDADIEVYLRQKSRDPGELHWLRINTEPPCEEILENQLLPQILPKFK